MLMRILSESHEQLARAAILGLQPLPLGAPSYPCQLAAIADPPPLLWLRGQVAVLTRPAVAVVGSRAATPYALTVAARLAADLVAAGVTVVSGLARGVDAAAHRAAVAADGCSIAVLGSGADRIYPPEHRRLADDLCRAGGLISELPPGTPPLKHHFPLRNRIISGLSQAVVIVEAPEKSGALITATAAAEQGKEVMVVPGPVTGGRNRGGHRLIQDGAKLVETVDDILQELAPLSVDRADLCPSVHPDPLQCLPETTDFTIDELTAQTGEAAPTALARLFRLELSGKIRRIDGGRFIRVLT